MSDSSSVMENSGGNRVQVPSPMESKDSLSTKVKIKDEGTVGESSSVQMVRSSVITMKSTSPNTPKVEPKEEPKRTLVRLEDGSYYLSSQVVGIRIVAPPKKSPPQSPKPDEPYKDGRRPKTPQKEESSLSMSPGKKGSSSSSSSVSSSQEVSPLAQQAAALLTTHEPKDDGRRKGERVTRKRTVRYDPSEYVFPTLKRKKKDPALEGGLKVKKKRGRKPLKKSVNQSAVIQGRPGPKNLGGGGKVAASIFGGEDSGGSGSNTSGRGKWDDDEESICLCSICNFSGNKTNDRMVSCSGCSNQGHHSCIVNSKMGIEKNWLCPDCREAACVECEQTSNKELMISCDLCGESFHYSCHIPQVKVMPKGPWRCSRCPSVTTLADIQASILGPPMGTISLVDPPKPLKMDIVSSDLDTKSLTCLREVSAPSSPATCLDMKCEDDEVILVSDSESIERDPLAPDSPSPTPPTSASPISSPQPPLQPLRLIEPFGGVPVDPTIPDPTSWTSKEVYFYFKQHFEDTIAAAFQDQDIDGQSLLLMQRSDVLKGLGFKLGVALRVLYHIRKLQIRRSDLRLLWA